MSRNNTFRLGFYFTETKRLDKETASSKCKPFLRYFKEGDVVLDAGCGVGIELSVVSDFIEYGVGLDIDSSVLRIAKYFLLKKTKKIDFLRADVCFLPFKTSSFSKILCFDVLEHLTHPEKMADNIRKVLCSKGECFVRIPNKWTLDEFLLMIASKLRHNKDLWNVRHVSFFDLGETVQLFSNEGFSYLGGYTKGSFISILLTAILNIASVLLNVLFYNNYYKNRYYFVALYRFHPQVKIFYLKRGLPKYPLFNYLTMVFRYQ